MKSFHPIGLSPNAPTAPADDRRQQLVDFWNRLRVCEELGATSWEVLEPLERLVTECLNGYPPDIAGAESLTAKAMLLIAGDLVL